MNGMNDCLFMPRYNRQIMCQHWAMPCMQFSNAGSDSTIEQKFDKKGLNFGPINPQIINFLPDVKYF